MQADGCNLAGMDQCLEDTKLLKLKTCIAEDLWKVSDIPDPNFRGTDMDEESCQMIIEKKAPIPVETPDDCLKAKFSMDEYGKITRRFFEYNNKNAKNIGDKIEDVIPDEPILCYVESALYPCPESGEFGRLKFEIDNVHKFHELRYWIDENDVPKRLKQIQSQANANAP